MGRLLWAVMISVAEGFAPPNERARCRILDEKNEHQHRQSNPCRNEWSHGQMHRKRIGRLRYEDSIMIRFRCKIVMYLPSRRCTFKIEDLKYWSSWTMGVPGTCAIHQSKRSSSANLNVKTCAWAPFDQSSSPLLMLNTAVRKGLFYAKYWMSCSSVTTPIPSSVLPGAVDTE